MNHNRPRSFALHLVVPGNQPTRPAQLQVGSDKFSLKLTDNNQDAFEGSPDDLLDVGIETNADSALVSADEALMTLTVRKKDGNARMYKVKGTSKTIEDVRATLVAMRHARAKVKLNANAGAATNGSTTNANANANAINAARRGSVPPPPPPSAPAPAPAQQQQAPPPPPPRARQNSVRELIAAQNASATPPAKAPAPQTRNGTMPRASIWVGNLTNSSAVNSEASESDKHAQRLSAGAFQHAASTSSGSKEDHKDVPPPPPAARNSVFANAAAASALKASSSSTTTTTQPKPKLPPQTPKTPVEIDERRRGDVTDIRAAFEMQQEVASPKVAWQGQDAGRVQTGGFKVLMPEKKQVEAEKRDYRNVKSMWESAETRTKAASVASSPSLTPKPAVATAADAEEMSRLREQLKASEATVQELEQSKKDAEKRATDAEAKCEKLSTELGTANSNWQETQRSHESLTTRVSELEADRQSVDEQRRNALEKLKASEAKYEEDMAKLRSELERAREECERMKERTEAAEASAASPAVAAAYFSDTSGGGMHFPPPSPALTPGGRPRAPTVNPSRDVFRAQLDGEVERLLATMSPAEAETVEGPLSKAVDKIRSFVTEFLNSTQVEESFLQDQNQREIQRLLSEKRAMSNDMQARDKEIQQLHERIYYLEGELDEMEEKHRMKVAQLEASLQASLQAPPKLQRIMVADEGVAMSTLPLTVRKAAEVINGENSSLNLAVLTRSVGVAVKAFSCWQIAARYERELRCERNRFQQAAEALRNSILETQKVKMKLAKLAATTGAMAR
ncbi:hypothetical protein NFJ02_34g87110 [Pycnococcus provasolii]